MYWSCITVLCLTCWKGDMAETPKQQIAVNNDHLKRDIKRQLLKAQGTEGSQLYSPTDVITPLWQTITQKFCLVKYKSAGS